VIFVVILIRFEQPLDLTEFDWVPELLVACHESDAQNARLARHIWEDNGLDVPDAYAPTLLKFLGKSDLNTSCAH
jgi:hypothetical protein